MSYSRTYCLRDGYIFFGIALLLLWIILLVLGLICIPLCLVFLIAYIATQTAAERFNEKQELPQRELPHVFDTIAAIVLRQVRWGKASTDEFADVFGAFEPIKPPSPPQTTVATERYVQDGLRDISLLRIAESPEDTIPRSSKWFKAWKEKVPKES